MDDQAFNNFELRWLTTLAVVSQVGSFTAAAAQLHMTQSAVSQQVAALERWAGVQLLCRRPVELTEAGRLVISRHRDLLSQVGRLSSELALIRDGLLGAVHVGAFLSACRNLIPQTFSTFSREHPRVVLRLSQMEPGPALVALEHGDIEIAVIFSYADPEVMAPLQPFVVCDEAVQLAMPLDHQLAQREMITMEDLDLDQLVPASDAFVYPPAPDDGGFRYFGDDFLVLMALVASGHGIALVPGLAASPPPSGVVLRPLAGDDVPRRRIVAVLDTSREQPSAAIELVTIMQRVGTAAA
jgi:DNA-binding transcriptional LysR family regulator